MNKYLKLAEEKLTKEFNEGKFNKYAKAVSKEVFDAIISFAKQEDEFAQAIVQCDKTFAECCAEVVKDVSGYISDIEAYKRAVQFYFPGAGVRFEMKIDLCASVNSSQTPKTLDFSLMDLLG